MRKAKAVIMLEDITLMDIIIRFKQLITTLWCLFPKCWYYINYTTYNYRSRKEVIHYIWLNKDHRDIWKWIL